MTRIVIIGCGVSGLTTALALKKDNASYDITIVARDLVGDINADFTSPFAGADWHSFAGPDDLELQQFDIEGYKKLHELASNPAAGIWAQSSHNYYAKGNEPAVLPWFRDKVDEFEVIDRNDLPAGIGFGYKFRGMVISVPIYLQFLFQEALRCGIVVKRVHQLKNVDDARSLHHSGETADIVVNCSGLLGAQLGGYTDPKRRFPVKGQVLHVRNTASKPLVVERGEPEYPNEMLYIMPRKEGGSIIGGCFITEFDSVEEDKGLTQRIINRALKYAPELVDREFKNNASEIDIIRVGVGQRPFRDGGVRVEADPSHKWLVHNYGAGGGGYQGSFGFSSKVVHLVRRMVKPKL